MALEMNMNWKSMNFPNSYHYIEFFAFNRRTNKAQVFILVYENEAAFQNNIEDYVERYRVDLSDDDIATYLSEDNLKEVNKTVFTEVEAALKTINPTEENSEYEGFPFNYSIEAQIVI